MNLHLHNKIALVTGASRGLGFAVARLLAHEGAQVAINSRNPEALQKALHTLQQESNTACCGFAADISDPATPERLIAQTVERFGGLDLLVANAGGPPAGSFESFDDAAWQKAFETNLMSNVRLIRAALPHLRKSSCASVLTITSYSVKQPIPNLVLSNSLRAATVGLTKTLALELGNQGIRCNSILPAWTETERVTELMQHRADLNHTTIEEEIRKQAKDSPLGRLGKPEEFAAAAVFLLSPLAAYITGVMLSIDGGMYKGTI